jgi:hypothetical protein
MWRGGYTNEYPMRKASALDRIAYFNARASYLTQEQLFVISKGKGIPSIKSAYKRFSTRQTTLKK